MVTKEDEPGSEDELGFLASAAVEAGAEVTGQETEIFGKTKGIKDALGDGKIDFHPELLKVKFQELLGQQFLLKQVRIIDDWDGQFGASSFALILIEFPDGSLKTSIAGGKAVMRQVRKLVQGKLLPVRVTLNQVTSGGGDYYLFE